MQLNFNSPTELFLDIFKSEKIGLSVPIFSPIHLMAKNKRIFH